MSDAGSAAVGKDAHALTGLENLVGLLNDGNQGAAVEFDSDFNTIAPGCPLLDGLTGDTAGHRTQHRGNIGPATAADRAACDSADHRTCCRTDNAAGSFDLHRAHAFHDTHAHILFAPHFVTGLGTATESFRTTGENCQGQQRCRNPILFIHVRLSRHHSFMLNARWKRSAISSRPIR